jgi:hypothetical protein
MSFTQRLELGGAGSAEFRSVAFTTDGEATLTAYVLSSSSSADRALALYTSDGTEVDRGPAYGAPSDTPEAMLVAPEAGTYYVASPSSGVSIYYLELAGGPPPERPAWDDVAAPTITDVTVSGGEIVVAYDGVVGFDGADLATATLLDGDGNEVDTNTSGTPGASGTIALTPSASGDYEVHVALTRTDEDTAKTSDRAAAPAFTLPLAAPEIHTALTTAVDGDRGTLTVEWTATPEAEGYDVAYREAGATDWTTGPSVTGAKADISDLVPGATYELRVTARRGEDAATSAAYEATVADTVERWLTAHAGISSYGSVTEHEDGALLFDVRENNGKIADSEDGFLIPLHPDRPGDRELHALCDVRGRGREQQGQPVRVRHRRRRHLRPGRPRSPVLQQRRRHDREVPARRGRVTGVPLRHPPAARSSPATPTAPTCRPPTGT